MNVEFISSTLANGMPTEDIICYCARVSTGSPVKSAEDDEQLLSYLIANKHWSPFEMVDMTVKITTSRAISHQIVRHKSFSFQEFSQRYSKVTQFEPIELREQSSSNRQSSEAIMDYDDIQVSTINGYMMLAESLYEGLLSDGVAKEVARFVLPECTQTSLFMKGSARSWIHYLQVRLDEYTQKEHRLVAESILNIFKDIFPVTYKLLFGYGI
jgi:thymidylate synthase (FAD)